jgi:methyltransferase
MIALPLVHTAWITAIFAAAGNVLVLRNRLRVEEGVLDSAPAYRAAMSGKPRFLPRIF